jgi:MFS family permease
MNFFGWFMTTYFLTVGLSLIIFNKRVSRYELSRQRRKSPPVDENSIKTRLYIAGALFLFSGFLSLAWAGGFFSR